MGVAGLWQLLDPTGRPVRLETLEGKVLAIGKFVFVYQHGLVRMKWTAARAIVTEFVEKRL